MSERGAAINVIARNAFCTGRRELKEKSEMMRETEGRKEVNEERRERVRREMR